MSDGDELALLLMSGSWYPENAYMTLLSDALREAGVEVRTPPLPLFFPLTRAVLANPEADAMQLDWIYDYYVTTGTGFGPANALLSFLRAAAFLLDVALVPLLGAGIVRTVHNERHHEGLYPRTERIVNECVFAVADAVTVKCGAAADAIAAAYRVPEADEMAVISGRRSPAWPSYHAPIDYRDLRCVVPVCLNNSPLFGNSAPQNKQVYRSSTDPSRIPPTPMSSD
jgi:hypothetical protein